MSGVLFWTTQMKIVEYILIACIILLVVLAVLKWTENNEFDDSCTARGGVSVRGIRGLQCISRDSLKP